MADFRTEHQRGLDRLRELVDVVVRSSERFRDGARRTRNGRLQQVLMSAADLASRHAEELSVSLRNSSGMITTSVPIPWLDETPSDPAPVQDPPERLRADMQAAVAELRGAYAAALACRCADDTRQALDRQLAHVESVAARLAEDA